MRKPWIVAALWMVLAVFTLAAVTTIFPQLQTNGIRIGGPTVQGIINWHGNPAEGDSGHIWQTGIDVANAPTYNDLVLAGRVQPGGSVKDLIYIRNEPDLGDGSSNESIGLHWTPAMANTKVGISSGGDTAAQPVNLLTLRSASTQYGDFLNMRDSNNQSHFRFLPGNDAQMQILGGDSGTLGGGLKITVSQAVGGGTIVNSGNKDFSLTRDLQFRGKDSSANDLLFEVLGQLVATATGGVHYFQAGYSAALGRGLAAIIGDLTVSNRATFSGSLIPPTYTTATLPDPCELNGIYRDSTTRELKTCITASPAAYAVVPNTARLLEPGGDQTVVVLGDSIASETPYQTVNNQGMTFHLQNLFAADPEYTEVTGSNLFPQDPSALTIVGTCSGAGCSYSGGVLTLRSDTTGPTNFEVYAENTGANEIDISASPTSRYLLSFDADLTGLAQNSGPQPDGTYVPTTTTASDFDYLKVEILSGGSCTGHVNEAYATVGMAEYIGSAQAHYTAWPDAPGKKYYFVIDPTTWGNSGTDLSGSGLFGGTPTCKLHFRFRLATGLSNLYTARSVVLSNIVLKQMTKSVRIWRAGCGGDPSSGVRYVTWPVARGRIHCQTGYNDSDGNCLANLRPHPVTAALLQIGSNDFSGNQPVYKLCSAGDHATCNDDGDCEESRCAGGTCTCSGNTACDSGAGGTCAAYLPASTPTIYFDNLANIKTDLENVGIDVLVKSTAPSRDIVNPATTWGSNNWRRGETWRQFARAERTYLQEHGWYWIDSLRYWEQPGAEADQSIDVQIPVSLIPTSTGVTASFPFPNGGLNRNGKMLSLHLATNGTTAGSDSSNKLCFNVWQRYAGAALKAADCCTDSGSMGEFAALTSKYCAFDVLSSPYPSVAQSGSAADFYLKVTCTGTCPTITPTVAGTGVVTATVIWNGSFMGAESPFYADFAHPGSTAYRIMAEKYYEKLTGKPIAWN